jgi:hypothetical protein
MCKVLVLPTTSDDGTIDIILFKLATKKENVSPMRIALRPTGTVVKFLTALHQVWLRFQQGVRRLRERQLVCRPR